MGWERGITFATIDPPAPRLGFLFTVAFWFSHKVYIHTLLVEEYAVPEL